MIDSLKKEEMAFSYLLAVCTGAGIEVEREIHDEDSVDVRMKDRIQLENGKRINAQVAFQLKSTSSTAVFTEKDDVIKYQLKKKNYDDLRSPSMIPLLLGLLILPDDENTWVQWKPDELILKARMYYLSCHGLPESTNTADITVSIDKNNVIKEETVRELLGKAASGELE